MIIKPNIGGSGAKIVKFNSPQDLRTAAEGGFLDLGIDHTALVQEYLEAQGDRIIRVEILGGEYLYAIQVFLNDGEFNLCPADYCQPASVAEPADSSGLADGVSGRKAPVERFTPPSRVIDEVKQIMSADNIEVGGVEYLVNSRDDQVYFYDINALSNFVANPIDGVGFDPFPQLVDYLLVKAGLTQPAAV